MKRTMIAMTCEATPREGMPVPEWGGEIEHAAGGLGLRCSTLTAIMATDMGIPCAIQQDDTAAVMLLWSTERRPMFAYRTPDQAIELSAKVLQPAIQFGLDAEMGDDQIASMSRMIQGIAFMVNEDGLTIARRRRDVEVVRKLDGAGPRDVAAVTIAIRELMTVQNVFRQWLHGELTEPIMDIIACNYVLSKTP